MISTRQLLAAGFTRSGIRRQVRAGRLHPVHRGVYAVGHLALTPRAREAAALLACGAGAVLSHRTAAARWGYLPSGGEIDVTVAGNRRHRDGIRVHRAALRRQDVRRREGLPLTSPIRTLADLTRTPIAERELEAAVSEALFRRHVTDLELQAVPALRALVGDGRAGSRHEAERMLGRLIHRAGLPAPLRNERRHGKELDFFWPQTGLNLELDGFAGHGHRMAFERDRRRDAHLKAHGIETLRVTWRMLDRTPEQLLVALSRGLDARD